MNTAGDDPRRPIDAAVWQAPDMRTALRARDIGRVYALLKRHGVSQRRIAAMTGQSQPEVSEIMRGRQVMAYDVLARIADGLGVPRGLMGLAYDVPEWGRGPAGVAGAGDGVASWSGAAAVEGGPDVRRRQFFATMAQATLVGLSASQLDQIRVLPPSTSSVTGQVGLADVERLEGAIAFHRAQDDLYGGKSVIGAVSGELRTATALLDAPGADDVQRRLQVALGDLHSLAGWASFDAGDQPNAERHLANAAVHARAADNPELAAKVLWQSGRISLHHGDPDGALKMFQLGQIAAQNAKSPRAMALMQINSAWAYAELGHADQVATLLARASDEMSRDTGQAPTWLRFMDSSEINGISGMAYTALSAHDRAYADKGIEYATRSRDSRPVSDARSRASDQIAIAANQLRSGNVETGLSAAADAIAQAEAVRSTRLTDRLGWIAQGASLYPSNVDARDLVRRIEAVKSV